MKKVLGLGALLAAVIIAYFVFDQGSPPQDREPAVPSSSAPALIATADDAATQVRPADTEALTRPITGIPFRDTSAKEKEPGSKDAPRVRILGRVVDEREQAVAGVPVVLSTTSAFTVGPDLVENTHTGNDHAQTTDADGRFAFPAIKVGLEAVVRATPEHLCEVWRRAAPTAAGDFDLGNLVAKTGGSISGSVRNADGGPCADAELEAHEIASDAPSTTRSFLKFGPGTLAARKGKAGEDGTYRLDGLSPGTWSVLARTAGMPKIVVEGIRVARNETTRDVHLAFRSGRSLDGVISDPAGNPIANAVISVSPVAIDLSSPLGFGGQRASVKTGSDGRFSVSGLEAADYNVTASMAGRLTAMESNVRPGTEVKLVLAASAVVMGVVRSAVDGAPITGFTITTDDRPGGLRRPRLLTGKEAAAALAVAEEPGLYAALDLQEGNFSFKVHADGCAAGSTEAVVVKGGDRLTLDIRLRPELSVSGVVFAPDGRPAPGATVTLQKKSKDEGAEVPGGARRAVVRRRTVERNESSVGLDLDDDPARKATSADDGSFRIGNLSEGDFVLTAGNRVDAPSLATSLALVAGQPVSGLQLALRAGGTITGRAFDEDGKPLAGTRVRARRDEPATGDAKNGTGEAITDAQGRFAIPGLLPGAWKARVVEAPSQGMVFATMTIEGESQAEPGEVAVEVESGKEVAVELRLPPKGSIFGIVTEAGKPVPGVKVSLQADNSFPMGAPSTTTDDRGSFVFRRADLGDYRVLVTPKGAALAVERPVSVAGPREHRVDIGLPTGSIEGRIVEEKDGRPLAGITVTVSRARTGKEPVVRRTGFIVTVDSDSAGGGGIHTMKFGDSDTPEVITDQDGRYHARFLDEGSYDVSFRGGSFLKETKKAIRVLDGRSTEHVDFSARRGATIKVAIDTKGEVVPFCMATLLRQGEEEPAAHEAGNPKQGFVFEGLASGTYTIDILVPEQFSGSARVVVEPGATHPVTIPLSAL